MKGLTPSAFLSHRWEIVTTKSDLPILFSYDDGVTMSETGIILFLDTTERVNPFSVFVPPVGSDH